MEARDLCRPTALLRFRESDREVTQDRFCSFRVMLELRFAALLHRSTNKHRGLEERSGNYPLVTIVDRNPFSTGRLACLSRCASFFTLEMKR